MSQPPERRWDFLSGGGEMGALMRAHDWSTSPLGDPAAWPHSLRSVVSLMINSGYPMFVAWGPRLALLYNDAYRPTLGEKHPGALGQPFARVWPEIWDEVGPLAQKALAGEAVFQENLHLVTERSGYPEDTWYTFSYSPVRDESGGVAGMFCACIETTSQVRAEMANAFKADLDDRLHGLDDPLEILDVAQEALARRLKAARSGYGEVDEEREMLTVQSDWTDGTVASLQGRARPLSSFGPEVLAGLKGGRPVVIHNVADDPRTDSHTATVAVTNITTQAMILVPLIRAERVTAILYLHDPRPRLWTKADVGLAEYVAERTWAEVQRARAEAARRQVEETLHRQLEAETVRLRDLFEQAPSFMAVMRGPDHVFELANGPYQQLIGHREVIGLPVAKALPEVVEQGFLELLDGVYRTGDPYVGRGVTVMLLQADGVVGERVLDFVYQPIRDGLGRIDGIFVEGIDITDRYEADERLKIAQRAGRIGAFEWFPEDGRLEVSPEYRQLFGLAPDVEVTADLLVGLVVPDDRANTGPAKDHETGNPLEYAEYRIRRADTGELRWIARQGEAVQSETGGSRRYLGVAFDITERRSAEDALRRLNDTLEQRVDEALAERKMWADVFEATDVLLCVVDKDYNWLAVNRAFVALCEEANGFTPRAGDNMLEAYRDYPRVSDIKANLDRALTGELFSVQVPLGNNRPHEIKYSLMHDREGRPIGILQIAQDISERVRNETRLRDTEEALRQAQKMEAVGQLTGGIAHDFNNLLQGIMGSLDFVQKRIGQARYDDLDRFISGAVTSASRAAALTHRLLAFSRRQPLNPKPVQANPLIASMEDLLHRTLGETVDLALDLLPQLWLTLSDSNQLESAVLNLAINARDAMPGGGVLSIVTRNLAVEAEDAARLGMAPGDYVTVEVADTGVGMAPETLERAFDPFYTTKPLGQGTGLGLSMIYGFARQSDGAVRIESKLGEGTQVRLYLPRFRGEAGADEALKAPELAKGAGEIVLVVEDEQVVRELIVEVLDDLGYRSLEAADGPSALTILQSDQRIDLLVTDIGLPGLNGRQVADAARKKRSELKVLLMTGYAENAAVQGGGDFLEAGMALMTKPFANEALAKLIQDMLAGDGAA